MGHHKLMDALQGNTMEQYTTPVALPQQKARLEVSGVAAGTPLSAGEPSQVELLAGIQGSRVALEGKIETVVVDVNLLRADLRKVSDKVKVLEGSIAELQSEVGTLQKQMAQATSTVGRLEVDRRGLETSPNGSLARKSNTGDHMVLGGWRSLATGLRYSEMEQWLVYLLTRIGA
ncbi:hypothetical protein NDU88_004979 [Pleurodeles waltl]|uniref:Uncharacterized protein n=1 Tax=Pleurodeles waltl TaxID=8319 RepID=A0AAV7RHQ4_PLEWA|nr:hypothetical protein NDU88_004979 [Pleurodeles waltl]